jgi:enoyl-CoA hydratase
VGEATILRRDEGPVAILTINRPEVRNAIDTATMRLLGDQVRGAGGDSAIRVIVITGAGEAAFSAGGDMSEMLGFGAIASDTEVAVWQDTNEIIERSLKPVIAAVNGYAYGGGTELAMACHIRVASETARFGQTEIVHDHIPGGGGTQRLPRLIPLSAAYEHLLTGDPIPAEDALRLGLVSHVWPVAELMERTLELAGRIAARSPTAVRYTLEAVRDGLEGSLATGLRLERALAALVADSPEYKTGIEAFLAKRKKETG